MGTDESGGGSQVALLLRVARTPGLRRVQLAFAAFAFCEHATWLAILVYALQRGGAREVGIVAVAQLIPGIIGAPFAAYAGDRFRPQRALAFGYAAQAISMAATAAAMTAGWSLVAYIAATCAATCITFTRPVMGSLLPVITHSPRDLVAANVVAGLIEQVGVFAGPLAAGVLMGVWSPTAVFVLGAAAVGYASASVLFVDALDDAPDRPPVGADDVMGQIFAGFSTLRTHRRLRALVILGASAGLVKGVGDVIFVTFADARLDGSNQAGWLAAAYGLGAICGAAGTTRMVRSARVDRQYLSAAVFAAAALVGLAIIGQLGPALAAFALMGAGETILQLTTSVSIQRNAPSDVLARVFGILEGLNMGAIALGSLAVTVLVAATSVGGAFVVLAAALLIFVVTGVLRLRRHGTGLPLPDESIVQRLIADPLFAPLSAPMVERLARGAEPMTVEADTIVFAQGEHGDRYYLVTVGNAAVTIDGQHVSTLGPGDTFGEIALVRDIPRTATVAATTTLQLLAIPRDDFLEAVTGHPRSRSAADATVNRFLGSRVLGTENEDS